MSTSWGGVPPKSSVRSGASGLALNSFPVTEIASTLPIDGELWAGRGRTHDDVRRFVAAGKWAQLCFCPFDIPEPGITVEKAHEKLARLKLPGHCRRVVLRPVVSTDAARLIVEEVVVRSGGEGLVLRRLGSKYWPGRTFDLLKRK